MKKLTAYFLIIFTLIFFNCKSENVTLFDLNGYYGLSSYFQPENFKSHYATTFLLKIDNSKIKLYGTVNTWGREYSYTFNNTKDTILIENSFKIYRKSNCDSIIYFETYFDNKIEKNEFQRISNIENVIDEKGINITGLTDFLNKNFIVGKYKYENKYIYLNENGTVENLKNFSKYSIKPRIGTSTNYDDCIIETDKGIWKYQKENGNLILTKYSSKKDEYDMYILSEEKFELEKITSH